MAAPTVQAVGSVAEGVGAVTPTPPTHQADDILLAYAEHAENATLTTATAGWAAVPDSPVIQTITADTTLDVWWKRATGAGTAGPTFDDPGNHIIAVVVVVRGCITTGNPWDVTASNLDDTADTSGSITGDTTTVAECLILNAITTGTDTAANTTTEYSGWADAALTGVAEVFDVRRTIGNGGTLGIAQGTKAAAGGYGPMTVTVANAAVKAMHSMALKPPVAATPKRHRPLIVPSYAVHHAATR
jgi:hypothetical protein